MASLACGCWTGPWWGINHPLMCAQHREERARRQGVVPRVPSGFITDVVTTGKVTLPKPKRSVHPADLNDSLMQARMDCERLIKQADERGDVAGADAWRVALDAIETADDEAKRARKRQTWKDEMVELAKHDAARKTTP